MAYTTVTPVVTALAGTTITSAVAAPSGAGAGNGDAVSTGCFLLVKNANASPMTVTVKMTGTTLDGSAVADKTFTVGATTNSLIGPLTADMKQVTGTNAGQVLVEYSSVTSLTRVWISSPW